MNGVQLLPVLLIVLIKNADSQRTNSTTESLTTINCFCTEGPACFNNVCSIDKSDGYHCSVNYHNDMDDIRWLCQSWTFVCKNTASALTTCCNNGSMCNRCVVPEHLSYEQCIRVTFPPECNFNCSTLASATPTYATPSYSTPVIVAVCVTVVAGIILFLTTILCYAYRSSKTGYKNSLCKYAEAFDPTSRRGNESSGGLSSAGGISILEPRHYFKDVILLEIIGEGGMGVVKKATRFNVPIAVKISKITKRDDCIREKEVYASSRLSHPNIINYFFSDFYFAGGNIIVNEFWITMTYYEHGSLFHHMKDNSLPPAKIIKILTCVASALVFLHSPVYTMKGILEQGGIVHRDLKTPNILLSSLDGQCVISDFGLAVMIKDFDPPKRPIKVQVGTERYKAPELLDESLNASRWTSFPPTDIYSFGLIMWELLHRGENKAGEADDHQVPYFDCLSSNPSVEEVRKIVAIQKIRPTVKDYNEPYYKSLVSLMQECWSNYPDNRPKALRILIKLGAISLKRDI